MLHGIIEHICSSRSVGKMRFLFEQQKQKFTDDLMNKFINTCHQKAGCEDFIIGNRDWNFGLSMKGMNGVGSTYRRLMIRLQKRVPAVEVCSNNKIII